MFEMIIATSIDISVYFTNYKCCNASTSVYLNVWNLK